ncbi:STAS/SEC14 domain-containing protein [Pseudonocardia spirodelae]|uniref:STAS/SEC14 domain-containing protein n=1 Tax=Pseudonocardia spirodelae TaxID=3133431 RepID=A0ABU8T2H1_9PSEU
MITTIEDLPPGVDGIRVSGTITRADYDGIVVPLLDAARTAGRRLRVLAVLDDSFDGMTPDALWEDVTLGVRALPLFDGCAVVSDRESVRLACRLAAVAVPYSLAVFPESQQDRAVAWLADLPAAGFSIDLAAATGVAVVHVGRPLRASDFDRLAREIEDWAEAHGELTGLVVSAPSFPGWENIAGAARHVAFVLHEHRRIRRIALAVDGLLPAVAPAVAGTLLHPGVKHFAHRDLEAAVAWAGAGRPAPVDA